MAVWRPRGLVRLGAHEREVESRCRPVMPQYSVPPLRRAEAPRRRSTARALHFAGVVHRCSLAFAHALQVEADGRKAAERALQVEADGRIAAELALQAESQARQVAESERDWYRSRPVVKADELLSKLETQRTCRSESPAASAGLGPAGIAIEGALARILGLLGALPAAAAPLCTTTLEIKSSVETQVRELKELQDSMRLSEGDPPSTKLLARDRLRTSAVAKLRDLLERAHAETAPLTAIIHRAVETKLDAPAAGSPAALQPARAAFDHAAVALRDAVDRWKKAHDHSAIVEASDRAEADLRTAMAHFCTKPDDTSGSLRAAIDAAKRALGAEQAALTKKPSDDAPEAEVAEALRTAAALVGAAHRAKQDFEQCKVWAQPLLCFFSAADGLEYPLSLERLTRSKEELLNIDEEAEGLELEYKKAVRRADSAKIAEVKSQIERLRAESLTKKRELAVETGRLLKLALDYFPELLRPKSELALALFTDGFTETDGEMICSGLLDLARTMVRDNCTSDSILQCTLLAGCRVTMRS